MNTGAVDSMTLEEILNDASIDVAYFGNLLDDKLEEATEMRLQDYEIWVISTVQDAALANAEHGDWELASEWAGFFCEYKSSDVHFAHARTYDEISPITDKWELLAALGGEFNSSPGSFYNVNKDRLFSELDFSMI